MGVPTQRNRVHRRGQGAWGRAGSDMSALRLLGDVEQAGTGRSTRCRRSASRCRSSSTRWSSLVLHARRERRHTIRIMPADDVAGVDAGGRVVERPERVRGDREAVADLVGPLDALDARGSITAAEDGEPEELGRPLAVLLLGRLVREHRRQARRQQHERVDARRPRRWCGPRSAPTPGARCGA